MYFYILDAGRERENKYLERIQGRLLNLLGEFHIEGEYYRVTSIRSVELLVEQAVNLEAKTIVAVGSDATLNKTINALLRKKTDLVVGFIPLDEGAALGKILGMSLEVEQAVKTLSGRLIADLDLGQIGEHYFVSRVDLGPTPLTAVKPGFLGLSGIRTLLKLEPFPVQLSLEKSYTLTSEVLGVQIINCRDNENCKLKLGNPTDGLLDILVLNKLSGAQIVRHRRELESGCLDNVPGTTVMHAKRIEILGPRKLPLQIEGQVYTKAPAIVSVAKQKIKMIVGKGRQF